MKLRALLFVILALTLATSFDAHAKDKGDHGDGAALRR